MGKILRYAKSSDIMNISIKYGKERFNFNLYEEVIINENIINSEAKNQPSSFAFLSMLHKKLLRYTKDLELELNKIYDRQLDKLREVKDPSTGRVPGKDICDIKIKANSQYQEKVKELNQAEHNVEILKTCISSFEQRKDIIQTLSANIRKEG